MPARNGALGRASSTILALGALFSAVIDVAIEREKTRVRVLHLLSALKTGGINSLLLQNIEHMSSELLEHHVCALGRIDENWARRYRALRVDPFSLGHTSLRSSLRTLFRLISVIRSRSIDVVHAHFPLDGVYGAIAASVLRIPLIVSVHGNYRPFTVKRIKNIALDKLSLFGSTKIVAVSESVARNRTKWSGTPTSKTEVIYNGVDTSRFAPARSNQESREAKARLNIPPSAPVVLHVGRLSSVKAQDTLIPMTEHLLSDVPEALLLIVGEGPMMPKLKSLVRQSSLENRVHLLGRRMDVPALMGGSDVFVLPSTSEGFSITLLEAMASGLPAVASDIPPNREALADGAAGKLVPVGDAQKLASEVAEVLQSETVAEKMSRRGRERATSKFDANETARQTEDLYFRVSTRS